MEKQVLSAFSESELDSAVLVELQDLMGDELGILVSAYIEDGQCHIDNIRRALTDNDPELAASAAHSLKSSSANMSAVHIAGLSAEIEAKAKAGRLEEVNPLLQELAPRFANAVKELSTRAL